MALIAWYKLDGNALDSSGNNKNGTPGANVQWVNGKIGQCGEFTGASSQTINIGVGSDWFPLPIFSVAFWIKSPGLAEGMGQNGILSLTYTLTFALNSDGNLQFRGGGDHSVPTGLHDDQWHHIVCTYDGVRKQVYKDGDLLWSTASDWSGNTTYMTTSCIIGAERNNTNARRFNGLLDDVRIYDHALSPKEVKELAKAKILHYKMDDMQESTRNEYLYPTFDTTSSSGGWSHWGGTGHQGTYGQNTDPQYIYGNQSYSHWVANGSSATRNYLVYQSPAFEGGYRSAQVIVCAEDKGEITNSKVYPNWNARSGGTPNNAWTSIEQIPGTHFYHCKCEGIMQDGSDDLVGFYVTKGQKIYFSMAQLEQKPYCTPYTPNIRTGTVHDSSGYDNHATLALATTPRWVGSESSKIGSGAYEFNRTIEQHINAGNSSYFNITEDLTLSAWIKYTGYSGGVISKGLSGGWVSNSYMLFRSQRFYITDGSNGKYLTFPSLDDGKWHHIAGTTSKSENNIKIYVDGELYAESTRDIGDIQATSANLVIGQGYSTTWWDGSIDDVRIYATALSDEDIKELYQTRGSIDSHGNLYASEVMDLDSKILSNGGHVWDFRYGLTSISGLKPLGVE